MWYPLFLVDLASEAAVVSRAMHRTPAAPPCLLLLPFMQRLGEHDRIDLGSTTHSWKGERREIEWEVGKRYCSVVALVVAIAMALLLIPLTLPKPKSAPMSFFFFVF